MRLNYNIGRVNMRAASLQLRLHFRCLLTSSPQEYVFPMFRKITEYLFPQSNVNSCRVGTEYHFICFLTCSIAEIMYCSSILNQRHLINWVGAPNYSPEEWQLCAKYLTRLKKACQSKTQTGVVFRGPETGPCRAQDGLATGRSDEGLPSGRSSSMPAQAECLPCPACLLAHAGTSRQKGGMPTLACPRLSAWHAGPSAPANRGPLQQLWRNPPIKGYSHRVWTIQWNSTQQRNDFLRKFLLLPECLNHKKWSSD